MFRQKPCGKNFIGRAHWTLFIVSTAVFIFILNTHDATAAANLISNPGLETENNGLPQDWFAGRWGENTATFSYPVAGSGGGNAVSVELSSQTSGDAKWYFKEVAVEPNNVYIFENSYISNVPSYVTAQYLLNDGSLQWVDIGFPRPSAVWRRNSVAFVTPPGAVSLTIFHLINQVGSLTVDEYSLSKSSRPRGLISLAFDDGWRTTYDHVVPILSSAGIPGTFYLNSRFNYPAYINEEQILHLQSLGHEIGAHTRTHRDLTTMSRDEAFEEIHGNIADLKNIGINTIETFAYPFGAYNDTIDGIVRSAGLIGSRTSDSGYNFGSTDRFRVRRQGIEIDTTIKDVQEWVNEALAKDVWLVLVFHHVDYSGEYTATTPEKFQAMVDYIIKSKIPKTTVANAIKRIYLK